MPSLLDMYKQEQQQQADLAANQNTGIGGDVVDLVQKGAIDALGGVAKFVGADQTADSLGRWSEEQMQTLTPEMKQSMSKRFINDDLSLGEGVTDWRSWVGQGAVLLGQMAPSLTPAGAVARGAQAIGVGARLAGGASALTSAATNAAIASGMQGQQVEDEIMNLSYDDLKDSPQFRRLAMQYNQQGLPADEVLLRAKQDIATQATDQVMQDPTLLGVNAMAGMVGDRAMGRLIRGKFGQTIRGNVAKGTLAEGGTEALQGGFGQYVSNVAQGDAGLQVDAMNGVVAAALEEGLIAGGLGGTAGGVGGAFQKLSKKQQVREQVEPIIQGQVDELAATGFDREEAKAQIQRMAEEAAIRMGADAQTASEAAAEAVAASTGEGPTIQEQSERIVNNLDQSQRRFAEADLSDLTPPNPADFGLTPEQAELLIDPDPDLSADQQVELYNLRDNPQADQYFQAEANYRLGIRQRAPSEYDQEIAAETAARQPAQPTMAEPAGQPSQTTGQPVGEPAAPVGTTRAAQELEAGFGSDLPADYQPTEAAQEVRQRLGVDLANQLRAEELASGQPTTTTPEEAIARARGQVAQETQDQAAREAGLDQMQAEQAAWDESVQAATPEPTPQPQTTPIEQDVVEPQRQPTEGVRMEELTPQQQLDYARDRGAQFGTLGESPELGRRQEPGASPRLAKKKTAKLNRKLNAIYERIAQSNPDQAPETQTFGYRPNTAMADAFAALQPTTETPTPEQFNDRVDQLVADNIISNNEGQELKKSIREVAYDVGGRTERMKRAVQAKRQANRPMTETGVPIDEVAGDYQSVSPVADQQPQPEVEEDYDVEADLGPDFEEDYGMAEPEPEVKVFEGATYDPQSRIGDTDWQESGGWSNEGATPIPDRWKNVSDTKEYVVSQERGGRAYSIWSRPKETTGQTMESGKEYDWDGDTVRFNDEIGRLQRRAPEDAKFGDKGWSNMKFNWLKQFTEDTGIEVPQEMLDAHRAKRKTPPSEEVVEAPTEEQAQAAADAQAKADKRAESKAKRLERERNKDVIGEYNGIDNAMAAMERLGVMETHYPHKLRAGPAKNAKFEVRKLPEKVEGEFKIHGWSTDTMSGFFIEGADARSLKPFAMLAGRGQNTMVQNAPSAIDWKDIKGIGLKTVNSPDFLRMVVERGGKFDSYDSSITDMLRDIEGTTESKIQAQAKAKTDEIMASAKVGELTRTLNRLRSGQIKPDQVVRGASSAPNPRKAAFEWLYREINNADPSNKVVTAVGLSSNGKPFKSETGARNQGKGQGASAVVPATDIVDDVDEQGFVWVKYRDGGPDGDGGNDPELSSESPKATPPKGAIKSATSMVSDIANQLYVPGMLPEHAPLKVDSFFSTMGYTDYMASLPAYQNRKENVDAWKAQNRQLRNLTDQKDEIIISLANKAQSELDKQEQADVPSAIGDLERDTGQDTVDQTPSESERRKLVRERDIEIDEAVEKGRTARRREPSIPAVSPLDAGTSNTDHVDQPDGEPSVTPGVTGSVDARGDDISGGPGVSVDEAIAKTEVPGQADDGVELSREEQQKAADQVDIKLNDAKNIEKTLPLLSPEQRTDVVAAEKRLYGNKKKGMMFTNGTGTGKTYTGCGVIKRVIRNGGKVLVVAPAGTIKGWQNAAKDLQFTMAKLDDKKSGLGDNDSVITSYQNFSDNQTLLQDKFDLVVYDEAHKIMANMQGDSTKATAYHYAVTGKDGKSRGSLVYAPEIDKVKEDMKAYQEAEKKKGNELSESQLYDVPKFAKRLKAIRNKMDKLDRQFEKVEKKAPTKALFLSASPFSGHKSVFYADGYLFDTDEGFKQGGYNSGSPQQQYLMKNFGYRMRYNKANQPGAEVDVGLLERDWADEMFNSGAMVGRTLNLAQDYSRQFPQVDQGVGAKIDALFTAVYKDNKYPELSKALMDWRKNGKDRQLAEALRIAGSLDRIEEHLKLGRKVVVFHQRMEMTITDPFAGPLTVEGNKELREFRREFPELQTMSFVGLEAAPKQIIDHFGSDRVGLFNGQVTKTRNKDLKEFNKDGGKIDILVIQKDAGKEGLSAHDITGENPRALIITNTPQSPADAIQMEGRIYRFGLQSNAVIEYPTVQTNFEKIAFRDVVSNRTATAENLAMGSQARMLRTAFREGYTEPYLEMPNNDQGVGGKESDRTVGETSQLDRAKTYYYKKAKKTQQTKAAEGADYFATPEPIGLSMVNMAGLLPGESALEPSAGHGAIAHWFPESVTATAIEQSPDLIGDLSMFTDADVRHQDFEELNIVNKYDGVVMNPPFGHGGHLAIQHIDKATRHLNNGGRVVAIYPMGGLADKRFDKWYEEEANDIYLAADIKLPGVTFKRAGTGVMTRILVLDKDTSGKPAGGGQMNIDYTHIQDANELFDKIHDLEVPKRPDVQVNASDIGMSYLETDKSFIAELSGFSGSSKPASQIGKKELRKISERYFGEVRTNQGYWDDTHYAFETEKDRQRFAKAVLDTYNKEFKREKSPEIKFKDSDEIKFSKASLGDKPEPVRLPTDRLTKQEVMDFVARFKREYNGNIPIKFNIFGNTHEAYGSGVPTGQVAGGYSDIRNEIDLFADAHATDERISGAPDADAVRPGQRRAVQVPRETGGFVLRDTIRHELLGHFGLNTFSPADKQALLGRVLATRGNPAFADLWKSVDKNYKDASPALKAEEVFAKAAEIEPSKLGRVWTNIVAQFQRLLQKVGLIDRPLTRTQLQATINRIEKGLKSGTIQQQTYRDTETTKFRKQSPEDVETIADEFISQYQGLSNVNVLVVPNQDALAEFTNSPIEAGTVVKGAYMPGSDTIVMVADNLNNAEDARRVLRHELIAHKGLMQSLSDRQVKELTHRVMDLTKSKVMADIWRTVNKSYTNAPDAIKAEEVIARIAEEPRGSIGQVADQVIAWVMGAMRRSGLLSRDKVTLVEVRNMLNNVDKNLRTNSGRLLNNAREAVLFSQSAGDQAITVEEALKARQVNAPNVIRRVSQGIAGGLDKVGLQKFREKKYTFLTLRQIVDVADKKFNGRLAKYLDTVNDMRVLQNQLVEDVANLTEDMAAWQKKNAKEAKKLFNVMHEATIANVDPSVKFESMVDTLNQELLDIDNRINALIGTSGTANKRRAELINRKKEIVKEIKFEPNRRTKHALFKAEYNKLSPEAKKRYQRMRDHYINQRERMKKTLEGQIEKAAIDGKAKAAMLRQIRFDNERAKRGLYIPLARFGNYWIDVKDKVTGDRVFQMYESERDMNKDMQKLIESGYKAGDDFTNGQKLEDNRDLAGASLGFVADVIDEIKASNINKDTRDSLTDNVYQLYLQSMPERSIRKNFIHRKGVAGYSTDAIRALADQGMKQSRQQARLQFVDELEEQMVGIRDTAQATRGDVEMSRVANEMQLRHDWVKNPQRSSWAQRATSLGFAWMLGLTPAAAIVNLTQNLQVAVPVIGSKHGIPKTLAMMTKVTGEILSSVNKSVADQGRKGLIWYGLSGHERDAIQYGIDVGALDTTQAADLMGFAENPTARYNGMMNKTMNVIGWAFHKAEVFNREAAYLTAYRLEYDKNGGDAAAAAKYAVNATYDSHFDYNSLNRARFMQSDLAAVALQFKQYSQSMSYYLVSNLLRSVGYKNASKEQQRQARTQLLGTLGITFAIGGLGAVPMWILTAPLNLANAMYGDEDEPWDAETELKRIMSDYFGEEASQWMYYGSLPSVSGRISLNELWIRDPGSGLTPEQYYKELGKQFAGPVFGGVVLSATMGFGDILQGNTMRGLESLTPKAIKDILKAARFINEGGMTNRQGDLLVEDMSFLELAGQMSGFTPNRAVFRYDQNSAMKSYERHVVKRRQTLLTAYYQAWRTKDSEAMRNINKQIRKFNRSKWGRANPITTKNIKQSIKRRQKNLMRSDKGLLVNPKLERLINESAYWS